MKAKEIREMSLAELESKLPAEAAESENGK